MSAMSDTSVTYPVLALCRDTSVTYLGARPRVVDGAVADIHHWEPGLAGLAGAGSGLQDQSALLKRHEWRLLLRLVCLYICNICLHIHVIHRCISLSIYRYTCNIYIYIYIDR